MSWRGGLLTVLVAAVLAGVVVYAAGGEPPAEQLQHSDISLALSRGRVDEAIVTLARDLVAEAERESSPTVQATALEQLGQVYVARGEYVDAQPVFERAAAIWQVSGDRRGEAGVLARLADSQFRAAAIDDAARTVERLRALRDQGALNESSTRAQFIELEATLRARRAQYPEARNLLVEAFNLAQGSTIADARLAALRRLSGDVAYLTGDLQAATLEYETSVDLARRAFPGDHPGLAPYLRAVAVARAAAGDLATARDLRLKALDLAEALPPCHRDRLVSVNDLAISEVYFGDYVGASRLFERALDASRQCLGPTHSLTATAFGNMGRMLTFLGDLADAESMHRQAIVAWTANRGASHPFVALAVEGLAEVLAAQGRLQDAIAEYDRALRIRTAALGDRDPAVATVLAARASVLTEQRRYPAALRDLDRAEAIYRAAPAVDVPGDETQAKIQMLRASIELALGRPATARTWYASAAATRERLYGSAHPLVIEARARVASMDVERGAERQAFAEALETEAASRDHLRRTVRYLSERQALDYVSLRPQALDVAITLADGPADVRAVFDALIRSRGLVLDELAARARTGQTDPRVTSEATKRFVAARQRYANLTVQSLRESVPRTRLDAARQAAEEAERLIAEQSVTARAEQGRANAGLGELLASLPTGAALVSFVRYAPPAGRTSNAAPMYGAFIVDAERKGPVFVKIGIAARVEELVRTWRAEASRRTSTSMTAAGVALRRVVWDPVAPLTGNASRVFIVGDGALGLVSFAALPRDSGGYLVEDARVLHVLSTERDLLLPVDTVRRPSALIVGGPSFAGTRPVTQNAMRAAIDCRSASPLAFTELPGARVEAEEVSTLWSRTGARDVLVLSGADATETAVKGALSGRRVVHLATHGFFVGAGCEPRARGTRAVGGVVAANAPTALVRNPLTLAGLAFANANRRLPGEADDGILTAEEIASLDLSGTEWAVLSACDTGLGQIRSGEGVLGLRRAFQIAGARTVIMSLWSVDDQATRHWMQALYDARLTRNLDTAASVREASIAILSQRRAAKLSTHPFYWAAFVAAGDWR